MILITDPSRPFTRSPKGTVVRATTSREYQKEIDDLYNREVSNNLEHINLSSTVDLEVVTKFVGDIVTSAFPGHVVQPTDDLFGLGLDSLQAMEIIKLLKSGVRSAEKNADISWISMKYVYQHPTIAELAHAITLASSQGSNGISTDQADADLLKRRVEKMNQVLEKYTKDLPPRPSHTDGQPDTTVKSHVILTGSTGSLGTQLLLKLLSDPTVAWVTCLDRSADAADRVKKALATWPTPPQIDPSRVSFHQAEYKKSDFGLPPAVLSDLREKTNVIIHNAWKVDFNHSLDTFEDTHVRGVRNLVDFSASSPQRPRIVFVSSISSVGDWCAVEPAAATIPESLPPTLAAAQATGYAESKAVAENVLAAAAEKSGADVSIIRVGQIAGPVLPGNGAKWNETEWFPILLRTAKAMGKIPDARALGDIDWIPVDLLSSIIWELSAASKSTGDKQIGAGNLHIFHLVNPVRRPWAEMLATIKTGLGGTGSLQDVSMADWVSELESTDLNNKEEVLSKPAVKILEFFKGVGDRQGVTVVNGVAFSTEKAKGSSKVMLGLDPVKDEWLLKWIKDWGL